MTYRESFTAARIPGPNLDPILIQQPIRSLQAHEVLIRVSACGVCRTDLHLLRGELPKTVKLRTTPTLRTAHPDYQWLHRLLCVGVGEADLEKLEVSYDVYAVR